MENQKQYSQCLHSGQARMILCSNCLACLHLRMQGRQKQCVQFGRIPNLGKAEIELANIGKQFEHKQQFWTLSKISNISKPLSSHLHTLPPPWACQGQSPCRYRKSSPYSWPPQSSAPCPSRVPGGTQPGARGAGRGGSGVTPWKVSVRTGAPT